ncbi:LysR family transcriptional regulator [Methylophilus flavus]|uniref:LysR family transcriptional regulator n=1 Tax=Methylophilus flavus TaxID=640084 RepID=A0ABW3PCH5_9PROT
MKREEMADLTAFLAVAEERSFTKAAAKLGISQSALSQIIRRLEERLGMRLLTRTTRSVAPTDAGELLLQTLSPALEELDANIAALSELSNKPAGLIRITSVEHAAQTILWPVLRELLPLYPEIKVDITCDYGLTDIVAERYDAGVRLGEDVDKDMIATRISPDIDIVIVGSPAYFSNYKKPKVPQELTNHQCINLKLSTSRGNYIWTFKKGNNQIRVRGDGTVSFNTLTMILEAALDGFGLAFLPKDQVQTYLDNGQLISILEDWIPKLPGYHLYYPSRRQLSPAFKLFVKALRKRQE